MSAIDVSAVEESHTPGAVSGGVNTDAPPITAAASLPVNDPDPKGVDWHTPEGSSGYSWGELQQLSTALSQSSLVPAVFRRQPANVVAIALTGQELGWGVATAMRFIQVIDGKPTVTPEGMLALVRRAGHSVNGKSSSLYATVAGRRKDNGDEMEVTFTMEDATRAKLAGKDNWKTYPEAMLWARALAMLCRRLFSDVLLGAAYVPDEMGVETNQHGEWIPATATEAPQASTPDPDWSALKWDKGVDQFDAAMRDTKRILNLLPEDAKAKVRGDLGPPPPTHQYTLNVWAFRHKAVVDAARELGIEAAFKDTTPEMSAMDDDATPVVVEPADPPATAVPATAVAGTLPADADIEDIAPAAPAATVYSDDDDAADAAWVADALAADDTSTIVGLPGEAT